MAQVAQATAAGAKRKAEDGGDQDLGAAKVQKGPDRRCRHWAKGACKMGESCTFLHSGKAGVTTPCRHFSQRGTCQRGATCDFRHDMPPMAAMGAFGAVPGYPPAAAGAYGAVAGAPNPYMSLFAPQQQQSSGGRVPCRHWTSKGHCQMGSSCGFLHAPPVGGTMMGSMMGGLQQVTPNGLPPDQPCKHFQAGFCSRGMSCTFLHAKKAFEGTPYITCRHWAKGGCSRGESCSFLHANTSSS